jgi:hypothetical protein
MARIASQSKGGYYPTPPDELAHVCKRLIPEPGIINMLDACAGKGDALKQIADYFQSIGAEPKTFGVELEESRANRAKTQLDKVAHSGYEGLRASNGVFAFQWLNPPYDYAGDGMRLEQIFLADLTAPDKYMQPGGVIGFCIPSNILANVASLFAIRFENIRVYRFTDKNYPVFKQVVVFGRRKKGRNNPEQIKAARDMLVAMGDDPALIPVIDANDGWTLTVPVSAGEVKLFRGENVDIDEAAQVLKQMDWGKIEDILTTKSMSGMELPKPLLPLKLTHIATAIAAGAVDGNAGDHYRRGVTKRVTETTSTRDDKNKIEVETQRFISQIRIYSELGTQDLE